MPYLIKKCKNKLGGSDAFSSIICDFLAVVLPELLVGSLIWIMLL